MTKSIDDILKLKDKTEEIDPDDVEMRVLNLLLLKLKKARASASKELPLPHELAVFELDLTLKELEDIIIFSKNVELKKTWQKYKDGLVINAIKNNPDLKKDIFNQYALAEKENELPDIVMYFEDNEIDRNILEIMKEQTKIEVERLKKEGTFKEEEIKEMQQFEESVFDE